MRAVYTIINDRVRLDNRLYEETGPLKNKKKFKKVLSSYVYKTKPHEFNESLDIIVEVFQKSDKTELVIKTSEDERAFILLAKESSPYYNLRVLSFLSWDDHLKGVTPEQTKMLYDLILETLNKLEKSYIV